MCWGHCRIVRCAIIAKNSFIYLFFAERLPRVQGQILADCVFRPGEWQRLLPPPSRFWPPGRTRFRRAPCGWRGRGSAAAGGRPRGRAAPPRGTAWSGNRPPQCQGRSEPTVHRCGQSKIKSVPALWRGCGGRWQSHPRRGIITSSRMQSAQRHRLSVTVTPDVRISTAWPSRSSADFQQCAKIRVIINRKNMRHNIFLPFYAIRRYTRQDTPYSR